MLAIPGAIMFYGYIAYRYTSELVPALVLAGGIGLVDLARRLEGRSIRLRRIAQVTVAALAVFGFVANLAVATSTARLNNPGRELSRYVRLQEELSDRTPGRPFDDLVHAAPTLPVDGPADRIQIVGDCEAVYVGTGEPLWPWMPLEVRELGWDLDLTALGPDGPATPLDITLATPADYPGGGVSVHLDDGTFRGTFDDGNRLGGRRPRPLPANGVLRLRLVVDLNLMQYVLVDIDDPERGLVDIEISLPTPDWFRQQLIFHSAIDEPTTVDGVVVTPVVLPPLRYCEHLRAKVGEA
jgi:hypothetical protein